MSLQVWLPFNNALDNLGNCQGNFSTEGGVSYTEKAGKVTSYCLTSGTVIMPAEITERVFNKDAVTIAFWFYNNSTSTHCIFGQASIDTPPNNRRFSLFQYPSANDLHWYWQNETDGSGQYFDAGTITGALPSNKWTHICAVWDHGTTRIYINGNCEATHTNKSCTSTNWAFNTTVARAAYDMYYNDMRLYNHALSVKEIKELSKGLCLHYTFTPLSLDNYSHEYYPLEYIQTTAGEAGGQYIDTGIIPDTDTEIEITFKADNVANGSAKIFGANGNAWSDHAYELYPWTKDGVQKWEYNFGDDIGSIDCFITSATTDLTTFTFKNKTATIYGTGISPAPAKAYTTTLDSCPRSLVLLGLNRTNGVQRNTVGTVKLYSCKIWQKIDGVLTLVGDFLPSLSKSTNTPGLYDKINGAFLTNTASASGQQDFSYSPSLSTLQAKYDLLPDSSGFEQTGNMVNLNSTNFRFRYDGIGVGQAEFTAQKQQYIRSFNPSFLDKTFTVNVWAYKPDWQAGPPVPLSHEKVVSCTESGGWSIGFNYPGSIWFGVRDSSKDTPQAVGYNNASIPNNATNMPSGWHMLTGVFDRGAGDDNIRFYIDGALKAVRTTAYADFSYNQQIKLLIGAEPSSGSTPDTDGYNACYFTGCVSDVKVYATALSDHEVQNLYRVKESIDNHNSLYCSAFCEQGDNIPVSFVNNGIICAKSFFEPVRIDKDSYWTPVCVHYAPSGFFDASTWGDDKVLKESDIWYDFTKFNTADRPDSEYFEFLVLQQQIKDGPWTYYRWKQNVDPRNHDWNEVKPSKVGDTVIRLDTNATGNISTGGAYMPNNTSMPGATIEYYKRVKLCFANINNNNWFGCGINYHSTSDTRVPGYNEEWLNGWQVVYLRVAGEMPQTTTKIYNTNYIETNELKEN